MTRHQPVLAKEIYEHLPKNLSLYFDGTFGHGGHVEYILSQWAQDDPPKYKNLKILACDIDLQMLNQGIIFTQTREQQITEINQSYAQIDSILSPYGKVDFMLLDLGVNMEHFKNGERGFSIKENGPLDMRFSEKTNITAKDIIHTYSEKKLKEILISYGDFSEKSAEYLAKGIIQARTKKEIKTTQELKEVLTTLKCNQKKIAVIFQVLRIETNAELQQLEIFLANFGKHLNTNSRCAIITYHSIEDRMTKIAFKKLAENWTFSLVNKKVIQPHYTEVQKNKAARSAKLRIIEKI